MTNSQGEKSEIITPHFLYKSLGKNKSEREQAHRDFFRHELEAGEIDKIRKATNGNFALWDTRFSEEIGKVLCRRVIQGKPGRLRKTKNA